MNVSQDTSPIDYLNYFTNQLPRDLAQLAALRDELAVRQGSLTAAQDAMADRKQAAAELADAKSASKTMFEDARKAAAEAERQMAQLTIERDAFNVAKAKAETDAAARDALLARREASWNINDERQAAAAASLDARSAALDARDTALANDTQALAARVKAFQEKVASLSA
jgi:chromosome segregation ATPase